MCQYGVRYGTVWYGIIRLWYGALRLDHIYSISKYGVLAHITDQHVEARSSSFKLPPGRDYTNVFVFVSPLVW